MMYHRMWNRPWYRWSGHGFRNRLWMHHGFRWRGHRFGLGWCRFHHVNRHNLGLWFDRHRLRQMGINQSPNHQCLYNGTDHQRSSEVILSELRGLNRGGEGSCIHTFSISLHRPGRGKEYSVISRLRCSMELPLLVLNFFGKAMRRRISLQISLSGYVIRKERDR